MDRLDAMQLFVRIVERRSFTAAAQDMDIPRSTATQVVQRLETRLGVRLLQRSTRHVSPTLDGEVYYRRCMAILDDVEDAEGALGGAKPKGQLRVEVQGTLARHFLMPGLPAFFQRYPDIGLSMSESDRWVDLVHEGVDCILRFGELADSDLVARRLGVLRRHTCAAPSYIERYGRPSSLDALDGHCMVGIRALTSGSLHGLDFVTPDGVRSRMLPAPLSITGPESYREGARLGLGLAQMPWFHICEDVRRGDLVTVLEQTPPPSVPVSVLYARNRHLSPRVRVFVDWLAQRFSEGLQMQ